MLYTTVISVLETCASLDCKSVSIPALVSSVTRFPKARCATLMLEACIKWASHNPRDVTAIRMCNSDGTTYTVFQQMLKKMGKQAEKFGDTNSAKKSNLSRKTHHRRQSNFIDPSTFSPETLAISAKYKRA